MEDSGRHRLGYWEHGSSEPLFSGFVLKGWMGAWGVVQSNDVRGRFGIASSISGVFMSHPELRHFPFCPRVHYFVSHGCILFPY
jgi:hypothetical protein